MRVRIASGLAVEYIEDFYAKPDAEELLRGLLAINEDRNDLDTLEEQTTRIVQNLKLIDKASAGQ
jgi:hypothetical protein